MSARYAACARGWTAAVLASLSSLAGCRACQHGDVEEAASLQQPLLGSARAASLGGLPESVKSPFGVRLSAVVPASRGASDGCDGAEVLGGQSSSLAGSQACFNFCPLSSANTVLLPACIAYLTGPI